MNLLYIAAARKADGVIFSDKSAPKAPSAVDLVKQNVKKVASSSKLRKGTSTRHSLDDEVNGLSVKYNILIHSTLVLVVVTSEDYERRLAFQLLEKLAASFDASATLGNKIAGASEYGLRRNGECSKLFASLLSEFEDPTKVDTMSRVQAEIEATKGVLASNIQGVLGNIDLANEVEEKAEGMKVCGGDLFFSNIMYLNSLLIYANFYYYIYIYICISFL
jgi:hypothetical protein